MKIESDVTWLDSIDEIERWSAPAQDISDFIMRIQFAVYYFG